MKASISEVVFGELEDGRIVKKYVLKNSRGTRASFLNLGASWVGFQRLQDKDSLVLGCDTAEKFASQHAYIGATVGRWANRIGHGSFSIDGETINVEVNLPPHHLHGGANGLSSKVWQSHITLSNDVTPTLTFTYHSPEGEGGFPGNVDVKVVITLNDDDEVRFDYSATTDKKTAFNLTNHVYFNLHGQQNGSLEGHAFKINSTQFLNADETALPTGELCSTKDTALELSDWSNVHDALQKFDDVLLQRAEGYDHCYCFEDDRALKELAYAKSEQANVLLTCSSTLPGMQFYSGNFLGGTPSSGKARYEKHGAFCFEPGLWPDSPNHPHFPEAFIDPTTSYSAIIAYSFKSLEDNNV